MNLRAFVSIFDIIKSDIFMKIIICSLLIFLCLDVHAQQAFTAREGYATATAEAQAKVPAPKLRAIGTMNATVQSFDISMDMSTGKSNVWAYIFHDDELDSNVVIPIAKIPVLGYINLTTIVGEDAVSIEDFAIFLPDVNMNNDEWLDSKIAGPAVLSNQGYLGFSAVDDGSDMQFCGLGVNEYSMVDGLVTGKAYWSFIFGPETSPFSCFVDAENGETICVDGLTSVEADYSSEFDIYPVPVRETLNIVPKDRNGIPFGITLYDITGEKMLEKGSTENTVAIDAGTIRGGTIMVINRGAKNYVVKLVK